MANYYFSFHSPYNLYGAECITLSKILSHDMELMYWKYPIEGVEKRRVIPNISSRGVVADYFEWRHLKGDIILRMKNKKFLIRVGNEVLAKKVFNGHSIMRRYELGALTFTHNLDSIGTHGSLKSLLVPYNSEWIYLEILNLSSIFHNVTDWFYLVIFLESGDVVSYWKRNAFPWTMPALLHSTGVVEFDHDSFTFKGNNISVKCWNQNNELEFEVEPLFPVYITEYSVMGIKKKYVQQLATLKNITLNGINLGEGIVYIDSTSWQ